MRPRRPSRDGAGPCRRPCAEGPRDRAEALRLTTLRAEVERLKALEEENAAKVEREKRRANYASQRAKSLKEERDEAVEKAAEVHYSKKGVGEAPRERIQKIGGARAVAEGFGEGARGVFIIKDARVAVQARARRARPGDRGRRRGVGGFE